MNEDVIKPINTPMTIKRWQEKKEWRIGSLEIGSIFICKDTVESEEDITCILITHIHDFNYSFVNLANGSIYTINENILVTPVMMKAEITQEYTQ